MYCVLILPGSRWEIVITMVFHLMDMYSIEFCATLFNKCRSSHNTAVLSMIFSLFPPSRPLHPFLPPSLPSSLSPSLHPSLPLSLSPSIPLSLHPSLPPSLSPSIPRSLVCSQRTTLYWRWCSWKSWYMSDTLSLSLVILVLARLRSSAPWTVPTKTWSADPCGMISIPRLSRTMSCLATSILPHESGRMVRCYSVPRVDMLVYCIILGNCCMHLCCSIHVYAYIIPSTCIEFMYWNSIIAISMNDNSTDFIQLLFFIH